MGRFWARPPNLALTMLKVDSTFDRLEFAWDLMNMGRDHQFPVHNLTDKNSI
jgi:hypothetical protein